MVALKNLRGSFLAGQINLSWQCPPQVPDTVYICPVVRDGYNSCAVDKAHQVIRPLNKAPSGVKFPFNAISGVSRREFVVFAADSTAPAPDNSAFSSCGEEYFVSVVIGDSKVTVNIDRKVFAQENLVRYKINLHCTESIAHGVLGYRYNYGGRDVSVVFPGNVPQGKTVYPPFFIPSEASLSVCTLLKERCDIDISYGDTKPVKKTLMNFFKK